MDVTALRQARWSKIVPEHKPAVARALHLAHGRGSQRQNALVAGGSAFVLSAVLLVAMAPPMVCRAGRRVYDTSSVSLVLVVLWSTLAAAAAGALTAYA